MSKYLNNRTSDTLYQALIEIKTEDEGRQFLQDLCTASELKIMEQRMDIVMLLDEGMIYSDIQERTGTSSVTISRVSQCLRYGAGGYRTIISRLKERELGKENKSPQAGAAFEGET